MRKLTSLLLTVSGLCLLITSVVLYIIPTGRVAYWADYHLLWLTKTQWGDLHINFGVLVVVCSLLHLLFNFKILTNYLRNRARRVSLLNPNFITAFIITAYVAVGTIFSLPPMNYILEYGETLKHNAETKYGVPPYGHAELSSLKKFSKKMDIESEEALAALRNAGITVAGESEILKDIAAANHKTPQEIYGVIKLAQSCSKTTKQEPAPLPVAVEQKPHAEAVEPQDPAEQAAQSEVTVEKGVTEPEVVVEQVAMPTAVVKPMGLGKMTLTALCDQYGLSVDESVTLLKEKSIVAEPLQTIKEIAEANDSAPMVILETLVKE